MPIANNPASRLHAVLAQVFPDDQKVRSSNDPVGQRLQSALGLQDNVSVMEQLGTIRRLMEDVALAVQDEDLDTEAFVEPWARPLRNLLAAVVQGGLQLPMQQLVSNNQYLDPLPLASLRACGQYFDKHGQTRALSDDELADIRHMVAELREAVVHADNVHPHLRAVLLDYLRDMDDVLSRVRLIGPEGLTEALDRGFGIWAQERQRAQAVSTPEDIEALTRWQAFIMKVATYTGWGRRVADAAALTGDDAVRAIEGVAKAIEASPL